MPHDRHIRWWARAVVGAIIGLFAATLMAVLAAAVGLGLGLVTWNRAAIPATARYIGVLYVFFVLYGAVHGMLRPRDRDGRTPGLSDSRV
jgi:hypothetical protein